MASAISSVSSVQRLRTTMISTCESIRSAALPRGFQAGREERRLVVRGDDEGDPRVHCGFVFSCFGFSCASAAENPVENRR